MTLDLFARKKHAPTLHHGDCLAVLRTMPNASVDAVVTDPPYLIDFMGKGWDSADGIAGKPEVWTECLRVLKPGGHLLAFGATRTYHRMACAIEDAGFEIRDSIHWMYGSGFPKSLDVSKATAKRAGGDSKAKEAIAWVRSERETLGLSRAELETRIFGRVDGNVRNWEDGISLPKTGLWLRIKAALGHATTPFDAEMERGDEIVAVEEGSYGYQKGGERWEETREIRQPTTDLAKQWQGWGTALKPAHEPVVVARKPLAGTVAANVERYGTGALNIDASRVGTTVETWPATKSYGAGAMHPGGKGTTQKTGPVPPGRWPPNVVLSHTDSCTESACDETCAVAELDRQSGNLKSGDKTGGQYARSVGIHAGGQRQDGMACYGDSGGASRFFPVFRYQAKASRSERDLGLDDKPKQRCGGMTATANNSMLTGSGNPRDTKRANTHPTVKPIALMEWLVTLVTPPGGTVLDPFMGSGTTGVAAVRKGFRFVGIEREDEYLAIARARIEAA